MNTWFARFALTLTVTLSLLLGTSPNAAAIHDSKTQSRAPAPSVALPVHCAWAPHMDGAAAAAEPDVPRRVRRLLKKEVTHAVALKARDIISAHHAEPFGTEIEFESDGKSYLARIEEHYHPPGGEARPWGYHPGASIFVVR